MTTATDERTPLADLSGELGWKRRVSGERVDVFTKGTVRIRVVWQGEETISGSSLFHDDMYESYTRDLATVRAWLRR